MLLFLIKRIFLAFPIFLAVTFLTFALIHSIPGGPFDGEREMPADIRAKLHERYGLDRPFVKQYCRYIKNVFKGDLGPSYKYTNWDVIELVKSKALVSLELGTYGMLFALVIGILLGTICARFQGRGIDLFFSFLSTVGICLPAFIVGPLLIYFFGIRLRWVNVACWENWSDKILPMLTIGILYASFISRLTKRGLCDVLEKPYIMAARGRGISEWRIFFVHALRNGLLPVVAYMGPAFAGIISGAIVTETIFQIPGLGRLLIQAIGNRDGMLILGIVNFYALAVIICNTLTDCIQAWLNPQIRLR
ncbi:MAG: ABC transporter permease [Puniceicoccales bacterium]|jgi:oligopeptide transport system permease protein|nr:ABC transporter permease [Puniceicoccales bacterium]